MRCIFPIAIYRQRFASSSTFWSPRSCLFHTGIATGPRPFRRLTVADVRPPEEGGRKLRTKGCASGEADDLALGAFQLPRYRTSRSAMGNGVSNALDSTLSHPPLRSGAGRSCYFTSVTG